MDPRSCDRVSRGTAGLLLATVLVLASAGSGVSERDPAQAQAGATAPTAAPDGSGADRELARGAAFAERGELAAAVESFAAAADAYREAGQPDRAVAAVLRAAQAEGELGAHRDARRRLESAPSAAGAPISPAMQASLLGALAANALALGDRAEARQQLERALERSRAAEASGVTAALLNDRGNALVALDDRAAALRDYREAAELANSAGDRGLRIRALANAARAAEQLGEPDTARTLADRAAAALTELPASRQRIQLAIHIALTYQRLDADASDAALRARSHALLGSALEDAEQRGDRVASAYALGYLGALYERDGRLEEALSLSRRARRQAERAGAPESEYLWEWQAGRVLEGLGRRAEAIDAYAEAVATLERQRSVLQGTAGAPADVFAESIAPAYFGLVDLLLRSAASEESPAASEALLRRARDTLELSKAAELRDYFRDGCVDDLLARRRSVERVSESALILYPVALPDRLELIVGLPGDRLARRTVPVDRATLDAQTREFHRLVRKRTTREYLPVAQRLYGWLVEPIQDLISTHRVDTLVFVPGGLLRTIPLAALHDGDRFLIERLAVAVTPSIELTDPRPLEPGELSVLLAGLSEGVAGYQGLSHVEREIEAIHGALGGEVLLNEDFRSAALEERLSEKEFDVVHIATHGEFTRDFDESFLVSWDGVIPGDDLARFVGASRFRDRPLELLTLSACETAADEERAALGLSGIAVKAGARSVVGTLWTVDDDASAQLMTEFYRQLAAGHGRADALRTAQLQALADPVHRHPAYWSPFLMISNWL